MLIESRPALDPELGALVTAQQRETREFGGSRRAPVFTPDGDAAYLVAVVNGRAVACAAWQATCSPFRNPLDNKERTVMRFMAAEPASRMMRALAGTAGVDAPSVRWRYVHDDPWFDNQVATLELDGRSARVVLEKTVVPEDPEHPALRLERVFERELC